MAEFFHASKKSGGKGAAEQSRYIAREGYHASYRGPDLISTFSANMPEGVSPLEYWRTGGRHTRSNGVVYREWEIALPRCLTTDQNIALFEDLASRLAANRPVQAAFHCPPAALEGGLQPHGHFMISTCIPDGIPRPLDQQFRRYNPHEPEKGGCRKEGGATSRRELREKMVKERALIADVMNEHLAMNGVEQRVDHRTNGERGLPEPKARHMGPARVQQRLAAQAGLGLSHAGER
jgi:hypothetical protein